MPFPPKKRTCYFALAALLAVAAISIQRTAAREGYSARGQSRGLRRTEGSTIETGQQETRRLREGTIITDQSGFFREDGDGATFVADSSDVSSKLELGALPNLNLERVVRLLKNAEEPSSVRWSVTGQVTEFAGQNFLLISRAVYKSASPPPVPEHVSPQHETP